MPPPSQNLPGVGFILTRKNKTIYNKGLQYLITHD